MKIKFLEPFHEVDGVSPKVGEILDVADEIAVPLVAKKAAEAVVEKKKEI